MIRAVRSPIDRIVLVSGSPRRKMLLEQLGLEFEVAAPNIDERVGGGLRPAAYVKTVARRKLNAYIEKSSPDRRDWALAADTVVALGRYIIGKPADRDAAEATLRALSGRTHRVITALSLLNPATGVVSTRTASTKVLFSALTEEEIAWYLRSGEWEDVAGGYRIQERGAVLVRRIVGSYSNVVGLPIETFYGMVWAQGYQLFPSRE